MEERGLHRVRPLTSPRRSSGTVLLPAQGPERGLAYLIDDTSKCFGDHVDAPHPLRTIAQHAQFLGNHQLQSLRFFGAAFAVEAHSSTAATSERTAGVGRSLVRPCDSKRTKTNAPITWMAQILMGRKGFLPAQRSTRN